MLTRNTMNRKNQNRNAGWSRLALAGMVAMAVLNSSGYAVAQDGMTSMPAQQREMRIDEIVSRFEVASHHHQHQHAGHTCGKCVELTSMSILFPVDATPAEMGDLLDAMPDDELAAFQPQGSRWINTATDGVVAEGVPFTITYSFVPDGTEISTSWGSGDSSLFAELDANFPGGRAAWKAEFAQALNRWSELTNITYFEVSDDGAAWGSPGQLGARGDVRIGMIPLGTPLAVNYYPAFGGDMVLDSADVATFVNSVNDFRSLRNTLMHEHGHGLGLRHVMPTDGTKLMEPFLNTNFDGPQEDDIRGAHFIYGDWSEYNDEFTNNAFIDGTLESFNTAGEITHVVEDVSLERAGAVDWYGFGADPGTSIAIRLEPIGTTYEQGAQATNSNPNPPPPAEVDAEAARDLGMRLYCRTSPSNIHLRLLAEIDFNAAGEIENHPLVTYDDIGFGYMLVEVFSNDGINDVQRYRLTISNTDIAVEEEDPAGAAAMSVFDTTAGQQVFDGTVVQFGAVTEGDVAQRSLSIVNSGDADLVLNQPTLAGPGAADYGFTLIQSTVAPGGQGALALSFSPQTAGVRQAVMTLPNNDPTQPGFSFILSGLGVEASAPEIEVTVDGVLVPHDNTFDMGEVEVGQTATAALTIRNIGNAALNISKFNFGGAAAAEYETDLTPTTLAPNATVNASVSVTPLVEGNRDAELRLFNNSAQSLFRVRFSAVGLPQQQEITDCNSNGIDDAEDIANGSSIDCNTNGVPDECEADTDGDGVVDDCDVCADADDTIDDNGNGVPDCQEQGNADEDEDDKDNDNRDEDEELDGRHGFCGTGSAMPMMIGAMSLCGMGISRRRRK